MNTRPLLIRFFEKVYPEPNTGCWLWAGSAGKQPNGEIGYGSFSIGPKMHMAHRVSYQIHKGEIPIGMDILHLCDNPICVNPDHLWAGTHLENMRDMIRKGRKRIGKIHKGTSHHMAKLSDSDIIEIRKMTRRTASEKYNISPQHASAIIRKSLWKHI